MIVGIYATLAQQEGEQLLTSTCQLMDSKIFCQWDEVDCYNTMASTIQQLLYINEQSFFKLIGETGSKRLHNVPLPIGERFVYNMPPEFTFKWCVTLSGLADDPIYSGHDLHAKICEKVRTHYRPTDRNMAVDLDAGNLESSLARNILHIVTAAVIPTVVRFSFNMKMTGEVFQSEWHRADAASQLGRLWLEKFGVLHNSQYVVRQAINNYIRIMDINAQNNDLYGPVGVPKEPGEAMSLIFTKSFGSNLFNNTRVINFVEADITFAPVHRRAYWEFNYAFQVENIYPVTMSFSATVTDLFDIYIHQRVYAGTIPHAIPFWYPGPNIAALLDLKFAMIGHLAPPPANNFQNIIAIPNIQQNIPQAILAPPGLQLNVSQDVLNQPAFQPGASHGNMSPRLISADQVSDEAKKAKIDIESQLDEFGELYEEDYEDQQLEEEESESLLANDNDDTEQMEDVEKT